MRTTAAWDLSSCRSHGEGRRGDKGRESFGFPVPRPRGSLGVLGFLGGGYDTSLFVCGQKVGRTLRGLGPRPALPVPPPPLCPC